LPHACSTASRFGVPLPCVLLYGWFVLLLVALVPLSLLAIRNFTSLLAANDLLLPETLTPPGYFRRSTMCFSVRLL
jgi:hypothetical protein